MKKAYCVLISIELLIVLSGFAATPEIKLSVRKDLVLPIEARTVVLETANAYLNQVDNDFIASIETIQSPYTPKQSEEPVIADDIQKTVTAIYDDTSILKVIGANFATRVRGTLVKGSQHYLQLTGGGLLKSGISFPAKIPQLEEQMFTVTISDINSRAYTLKMATATLVIPLNPHSSGATRDNRH